MKFFFDTEFIEGFKKPIKWLPTIGNLNKPYHSIQLISIGIVCEDGREYYAVSNEYNPSDASEWVMTNVLTPLQVENYKKLPEIIKRQQVIGHGDKATKFLLRMGAKSNLEIAEEIKQFVFDCHYPKDVYSPIQRAFALMAKVETEFYAYYADYDWVVFCSLFGTMMDLPKGFPMYCRDLKQSLDEKIGAFKSVVKYFDTDMLPRLKEEERDLSDAPLEYKLDFFKKYHSKYPKQTNEHNALDDAKWNKKLYDFIHSM